MTAYSTLVGTGSLLLGPSVSATPAEDLEVTFAAATGQVGVLRWRLLRNCGPTEGALAVVALGPSTEGIVEVSAGLYALSLTLPPDLGVYRLQITDADGGAQFIAEGALAGFVTVVAVPTLRQRLVAMGLGPSGPDPGEEL